eukprot:1391534-Karenia_brevis.AAC.1
MARQQSVQVEDYTSQRANSNRGFEKIIVLVEVENCLCRKKGERLQTFGTKSKLATVGIEACEGPVAGVDKPGGCCWKA